MTAEFEKDPERFCRETNPARATCLSVPMEMMLTAEMKLRVNGKPAYVPVGGNVGELLRSAGVRQPQTVVRVSRCCGHTKARSPRSNSIERALTFST